MAGLFHAWISKYFKKMGITPILQRRKLRHREVKWCRQSYVGRLVTCLRLEHNLFIPQVPLLIFSSRLHLFTRPLSHSFSSLQNKAQPLLHRKIFISTYKISPVSRVSEPCKHPHVCHCFEILLSSSTMLAPYAEEQTLSLFSSDTILPACACLPERAHPCIPSAHSQPQARPTATGMAEGMSQGKERWQNTGLFPSPLLVSGVSTELTLPFSSGTSLRAVLPGSQSRAFVPDQRAACRSCRPRAWPSALA